MLRRCALERLGSSARWQAMAGKRERGREKNDVKLVQLLCRVRARTVIYRFTSNSMRWRDVVARKNYANIRSKQFEIKIKAEKERRIALDPPEDGGGDDDDDRTCNAHNSYSILHARR